MAGVLCDGSARPWWITLKYFSPHYASIPAAALHPMLGSLSTTPPGTHMTSTVGAPSPITLARKYDSLPGMYAHRPATPTLTFPQLLEAIRLIAEDVVGHPQVGVSHSMEVHNICWHATGSRDAHFH